MVAALSLNACNKGKDKTIEDIKSDNPNSLVIKIDAEMQKIVTFEQGWNDEDKIFFYNTSQGSQLIPYSWFLALEQKDNSNRFRDNENIKKFGFIPQQKLADINPDGLPIGFVKDVNAAPFLPRDSDSPDLHRDYQEWMGFTCAACHTSEMRYNNQTFIIDGGSPWTDFQWFIIELTEALKATSVDEKKLTRFTKNILGKGKYNEKEKQRVKTEVDGFLISMNTYIENNYSGSTPYGFWRLDAFGAILNRVTSTLTGIKTNARPANAPVSYPVLWNTSQLRWVQWNGSVANHIARNIGEVTGVFGHTILNTSNKTERFDSSAKLDNLYELETLIGKLDSPNWGSPLPVINESLASKGKILYTKNCVMCHSIRDEAGHFPMTVPNELDKQFIEIKMIALGDIGTDKLMALNFVDLGGPLKVDPGDLRDYLDSDEKKNDKVLRGKLLGAVVKEIINKKIATGGSRPTQAYLDKLTGYHPQDEKDPFVMAYKARPLNGIWATAPYLHNGSVPNLEQLLLPDKDRRESFYVCSLDFDADKVGYLSEQGIDSCKFNTLDGQGNAIPGNSKDGHTGQNYTQTRGDNNKFRNFRSDERKQLIEYMKTL